MGSGAIRGSVLYHAAHDGKGHTYHAHRHDQVRACVERHDARPVFHDQLLESHLGRSRFVINHMTSLRC